MAYFQPPVHVSLGVPASELGTEHPARFDAVGFFPKTDDSVPADQDFDKFPSRGPVTPEVGLQFEEMTGALRAIQIVQKRPHPDGQRILTRRNVLKGAPVEVQTYNFGSVDSIGVIIFCAGKKRFSVPHARFLIHGVRANFSGNLSLDEKQIEESLKSLVIDQQNVAKVIGDTVQKTVEEIVNHMNNRLTLNPENAKKFGLVHEIKSELFPADADIAFINESVAQPQQQAFQFAIPPIQGFTRSADLDHSSA